MEKIIDKLFGEMEYKHSWTKIDSFIFLNKAYVVNIIAQAYKGDEILESQQKNYIKYKDFLQQNNSEIEIKLATYCEELYHANGKIDEYLEPKQIIFERDGSWGILFESDYDIENGVAVFFVDGKIKVGTQDQFI